MVKRIKNTVLPMTTSPSSQTTAPTNATAPHHTLARRCSGRLYASIRQPHSPASKTTSVKQTAIQHHEHTTNSGTFERHRNTAGRPQKSAPAPTGSNRGRTLKNRTSSGAKSKYSSRQYCWRCAEDGTDRKMFMYAVDHRHADIGAQNVPD